MAPYDPTASAASHSSCRVRSRNTPNRNAIRKTINSAARPWSAKYITTAIVTMEDPSWAMVRLGSLKRRLMPVRSRA